jgi:predicted Zn finger-like uncharacterized protein
MAIVIRCPNCSRKLRVGDDLVGKSVQCPGCKNVFQAAPEETPAPTRDPEPAGDLDVFGDDAGEPKAKSKSKANPPAERDLFDDVDVEGETRKSSRRQRFEDEDAGEERPSRRRRRETDEEDLDDRPSRRRGREKPGQVTAAGIMQLIGGILAIMVFLGLGAGSTGLCCLWPGTYYSLVVGIMAIIGGSRLLGEKAYQSPPPRGAAIMQIINIINFDITNLALGIISLVMLNSAESKRYFREE